MFASSLVQEIRDSERALKNRPPTNLPAQPTPFIGRAKELAEIRQLLRDDANCRLLTLLGPGGIGKTRLAIEAATGLLDLFPDGVYFVGLAAVGTAETIGTAIADAFGFTFSGNMEPDAQLTNYLRAKRLLLVVDNLEHLLAGAELFSAFALAATQTKILVTSREALRLQEEWLYPVGGMTIPKEAAPFTTVTQNGAIQLFVQQAQRADAAFVLNDENLPSVIHICRAVDGMPLGIELAAAWLRTMTCDEIAKELTQSIDILTTSIRNVPQRHRSLRAIVEQTWQRLTSESKWFTASRDISRFLSREAAQQVTQASLLDISSLVDKALCRHNDGHYEMHELLRQFAFEQLNEEELQTCTAAAQSILCRVLERTATVRHVSTGSGDVAESC
ncbi:hypothetical protein KFU94_01350 [Chloroflexi bacterium TSY]|nr:hypothetical protein [Chloroflexi bacterium TSY]